MLLFPLAPGVFRISSILSIRMIEIDEINNFVYLANKKVINKKMPKLLENQQQEHPKNKYNKKKSGKITSKQQQY